MAECNAVLIVFSVILANPTAYNIAALSQSTIFGRCMHITLTGLSVYVHTGRSAVQNVKCLSRSTRLTGSLRAACAVTDVYNAER